MKKIALPVLDGKLGSSFERCNSFYIYSIEDNSTIKKELANNKLQPGMSPYWLARKEITDLIVREIDINSISKFNQFKVNVFVGVKADEPEQVIKAYLDGTLETFDVAR